MNYKESILRLSELRSEQKELKQAQSRSERALTRAKNSSKTAKDRVENIRLKRDTVFKTDLEAEKSSYEKRIHSEYNRKKKEIVDLMSECKKQALSDIDCVDVSDVRDSVTSSLSNLGKTVEIIEQLNNTYTEVFGANTLTVIGKRFSSKDIKPINVSSLSSDNKQIIELVSVVKESSKIKLFDIESKLSRVFNPIALFFESHVEWAWSWWILLMVLLALMYMLRLLIVPAVTVLLVVVALYNYNKISKLIDSYKPVKQLKMSIDDIDEQVNAICDKVKKSRVAKIKIEANKKLDVMKEDLSDLDKDYNITILDIFRDFDEDGVKLSIQKKLDEELRKADTITEDNTIIELERKIASEREKLVSIGREISDLRERIVSCFVSEAVLPESDKVSILDVDLLVDLVQEENISEDLLEVNRLSLNNRALLLTYNSSDKGCLKSRDAIVTSLLALIMGRHKSGSYTITLVDTASSGMPFRDALESQEGSKSKAEVNSIYRVRKIAEEVSKDLESLYIEYSERINMRMGDFDAYNRSLIESGSKTVPYLIQIYYAYDDSILKDERLIQITRSSHDIGIIPIVLVDTNKYVESDNNNKPLDTTSLIKFLSETFCDCNDLRHQSYMIESYTGNNYVCNSSAVQLLEKFKQVKK